MARPVEKRSAKNLITQHQTLLTGLDASVKLGQQLRSAIKTASDALALREAVKMLKEIPVEEINRQKRGFRVKALRERGYHTVADLHAASATALAAVNGISDEGAKSIKRAAKEIAETVAEGTKIKLSLDDKNKEATQLVQALSRYGKCEAAIAACEELYQHGGEIRKLLQAVQPAAGTFKWLFSSQEKKDRAVEAHNVLAELLQGPYGVGAKEHIAAAKVRKFQSNDSAWNDFAANSARFFRILEDINPGILGTDDGLYGLPEELALQIQQQEFLSEGLRCQLRRYQEWGVKYILHQKRVLLGDEMGLGKTVQAIAAMVSLRNSGGTHFVVVCPASVLSNWCREITKMSDLSVTRIHGANREAALQSWLETGGVAVTTYETTGCFGLDRSFRFAMLIVDEAHYIKNPEAQRTVNVKRIGGHGDHLLFMTGTALENKVEEMVELIKILQPNVASAVQGMEYLSSAPQFRERVAPVYYRRRREDVLTELPELIETKEWCQLMQEEEAVYEAAVLEKRYTEARRVSWSVSDVQKSSKAQRMMELIEEAQEDGRKVIVFSFFLDTMRKVGTLLGDRCYGPINGSVSPQRRQEIIDEFDKAPAGSVLAAQIQAGGTGLNIQSASVVIICEPQFKPSIENQAISRAYRMGQTRNVLVYRLLCDDTVDEKITDLLESKQEIFDAFADQSVVAGESAELDEKTFGSIMQEETARISEKRASGV